MHKTLFKPLSINNSVTINCVKALAGAFCKVKVLKRHLLWRLCSTKFRWQVQPPHRGRVKTVFWCGYCAVLLARGAAAPQLLMPRSQLPSCCSTLVRRGREKFREARYETIMCGTSFPTLGNCILIISFLLHFSIVANPGFLTRNYLTKEKFKVLHIIISMVDIMQLYF